MIRIAENLWVGNSIDGELAEVRAVLNVARDLRIKRGWPSIEYAQVGLVDGPGNSLSSYVAAVLTLVAMMKTGKDVLVHCHEGKSRSVAVALMYLCLVGGQDWDTRLAGIREHVDVDVPDPHPAHREAFDKIQWGILETFL